MPRLYAEILDQVAWLDTLGLDLVWFTEHHFVDDGYLPSWTPMAGAMAARTSRVRFSSDICLLPFNHPVRLAEDLAVLDNLSGGRVEIGVGMGYAPHEFRGFGIPLPQRLSRMDEGLEVLHALLHRRALQLPRQALRLRRRRDPAALRAARRSAAVDRGDVGERRGARGALRRAPAAAGRARAGARSVARDAARGRPRSPDDRRVGIIRSCFVTDDPERDWPMVRAAERYRGELYNRFFAESGQERSWYRAGERHPADVGGRQRRPLRGGALVVHRGARDHGPRDVGGAAGAAAGADERSLERFAREVAPRLRAAR